MVRALQRHAIPLDGVRWGAYVELTKPRLNALAVISAMVGFYLGTEGPIRLVPMLGTLAGAWLIGGGANALNQFIERDLDARMTRTADRPIPSGRLEPVESLLFAVALCIGGVGVLAAATPPVTLALAGGILVTYVALYTPLKRASSLNTLVGAVPGALPILMGWSASGRALTPAAWSLFAIVFVWQLPHFLAICWFHQSDYRRAGYVMLPLRDRVGTRTGVLSVILCLLLVPLATLPTSAGLTGSTYRIGAVALGAAFAIVTSRMIVRPSPAAARVSFLASIGYLPLLLVLMMLDKVA